MWQGLKNWQQRWFQHNWGIALLVGVWAGIVLTNFEPHTWFLGWDSLASGFNPALGIQRSLNGVWQSFQGMGLLGGHGYVAQLPHSLFQLLLNVFIPKQYLRYSFTFFMLLVGVLGSYALLQKLLQPLFKGKNAQFFRAISSVLGATMYSLHLGTVQTFYVQLEPFIVMYGLFPWVLWLFFKLTKHWTKKGVFGFFLLNFALSNIGFIPPVFISYVIFLGIACIGWWWGSTQKFQTLKKILILGLLVLVANLYWLVTVAMFTLSQSDHYLTSKLNQVTTQEFVYTSQKYGSLNNVALLRGFLFDSRDQARFGTGAELEPIMLPWIEHLQNPWVVGIGVAMAIVAVIGLISSVRTWKKMPVYRTLNVMALVSFALLATSTFPVSLVSEGLRYVPVLNQAFRIPFSKLSMSATLFLAIFFAMGVGNILEYFQKKSQTLLAGLLASGIFLAIIYFSFPSFQGKFLYTGARVKIPGEYQQLVSFFLNKPADRRIALLPIYTYTGWDMNDWGETGYTGSGFLWYVLPQPIIARTFDVWSPYNETYRYEMQRAIYNQDSRALEALLKKYQISYLVIDQTVYLPKVNKETFFNQETQELFAEILDIQMEAQYGEISIYSYRPNLVKKSIDFIPQFVLVENDNLYTRVDSAVTEYGDVISLTSDISSNFFSKMNPILFPFNQLNREQLSDVEVIDGVLQFSKTMILNDENYTFNLPGFDVGEVIQQLAEISYTSDGKLMLSFESPIELIFNDTTIQFPKLQTQVLTLEDTPESLIVDLNGQLVTLEKGQIEREILSTLQFQQEISVRYFDQAVADITNTKIVVPGEELHEWVISPEIWSVYDQSQPTFLTGGNHALIARIPVVETDFLLSLGKQTEVGCDEISRGQYEKRTTTNSVIYISRKEGAVCEGLYLEGITNQAPQIIEISGRNTSGRSLRFYVSNSLDAKVVQEQLLPTGNYNNFYTLPQSIRSMPSAYHFNIENRSYGEEESSNELTTLKVMSLPISYDWLSQMKLVPENYRFVEDVSPKIVLKYQLGTGIFIINTTFVENSGVLKLDQSFDDNWIAWDVVQGSSMINSQKLPHLKYNNWANAWLVPEGEHQIIIIYWPQLLSFAGYGILGATFLFFIIQNRYHARKKS